MSANNNARLILPSDTHRLVVIGKTGSGKTQGALWQLSQRSYDRRPWVIIDTKYEPMIRDIPFTEEIGLSDRIPKHPGLYVVHPLGKPDADQLEDFLWAVHGRGNTGLFVDEGYAIPDTTGAFQAILTQGRSKKIPVITLVQRPNRVSRFVFSESEYIQLYKLTDRRDIAIAQYYMGTTPLQRPLPGAYYSWWWDNLRDQSLILKPVPNRDSILEIYYQRLRPQRRAI